MAVPKSPLTGEPSRLLATIPVSDIVREYKTKYAIDVRPFLPARESLELWVCPTTDLEFFGPPPLAGPPAFYDQLYDSADWAYQRDKWEFRIARDVVAGAVSLLDIGCGSGEFLTSVAASGKRGVGLETSPVGRTAASAKSLEVYDANVEVYSQKTQDKFDAVVSFQVLEHVNDPLLFLQSALKLVRTGGRLLISTPNKDSFLRYGDLNPLDCPPHHVSRWGQKTFAAIENIFKVRLSRIEKEPLQKDNIKWYVGQFETRYLPSNRFLKSLYYKLGYEKMFREFATEQAHTIDGHSIIAVYEKIDD